MGQLLGRRLLGAVPVLIIVSTLVFLLTFLIPGDPAFTIAGESASPEQIEQTRERLGLNDSVLEQFGTWVGSALQGDLGTSLFSSQSVVAAILDRAPVTILLTLGALLVATLIGVPAGILAAVRQGSSVDKAVTLGTSLGVATPNYFLGLMLVLVFALRVPLFPATGYVPLADGVVPWFQHLVLPCVTLGLSAAAVVTRQLRSSLSGVLALDYVKMARAKGMRGRVVVGKHALKNALVPVVTVLGTQMAFLLGGTVLIEQIFGLPGIGSLAFNAVTTRDIPMIQGVVLFSAVLVLLVNLVVDISYGWLNPKVRAA